MIVVVDGCVSMNGENEVFCLECTDTYGNDGCKEYMWKHNTVTFQNEDW